MIFRSTDMEVVLLGNYLPDKQESMERFAQMLQTGFESKGIQTRIWRPITVFARFANKSNHGYGKWLGYLDKWILFPLLLRWRMLMEPNKTIRYHICDHSNAPYLKSLPKGRTSITCHDVLAIRGALGHADAYCPASSTGIVLQKWILGNLVRAEKLATVSQFTLDQLMALNQGKAKPFWRVILNGFNAPFSTLPVEIGQKIIKENNHSALLDRSYILHLGSSLSRKNRKMLLEMVAILGNRWDGLICFAGQAVDQKLWALADSLQLSGRVVEVVSPNHEFLEALINGAEAFVFPSYSEGFGWPVIEAQACGTPVIASSLAPMPEVGGKGALYACPDKAEEFADALLSLGDLANRNKLIASGFENIKRFQTDQMIKQYMDLFNEN